MTVAANRVTGATPSIVAQPAILQADVALRYPLENDLSGTPPRSVQFDFSDAGLSAAQQNEFKADFARELARLGRWMADQHWSPSATPALNVVVSDRFRISKSLVPAWSGHPGLMQFPAWRVAPREAAIAHELVHVFLPNGNRLLAEGLAIYLQASIGGNPAFPNFGRPLHDVVRELLPNMLPAHRQGDPDSFAVISFAALDAIATPGPLTLQVGRETFGEEPRGQAHVYPLAGSFVQHLIETRGLETFRRLYARTPLLPLHQDAGASGRWAEIYELPLSAIETEWRSMIAGR